MWYKLAKQNKKKHQLFTPITPHADGKKKTKQFDFSNDIENLPDSKMPAGTTEYPDLPAGVEIPPKQFEVEKTPLNQIKEIETPHKPKELEELYGEDENLKDDGLAKQEFLPKNDVDLDLDKEISKIFDKSFENQEPVEEDDSLDETPNDDEEIPSDDILEIEKELDDAQNEQSVQPVPNPPLHDGCHCEIITMPGGRRIWRANSGSCEDCLKARDTFNQWQSSLFGA
jgi:hypothetical protein